MIKSKCLSDLGYVIKNTPSEMIILLPNYFTAHCKFSNTNFASVCIKGEDSYIDYGCTGNIKDIYNYIETKYKGVNKLWIKRH